MPTMEMPRLGGITVESGLTVVIPSDKHEQLILGTDQCLTVDGTLQVDGSMILLEL